MSKILKRFLARYDALERRVPIESFPEEGYQNYGNIDRLRAVGIMRDLERNFSLFRSIIHQFKINVVGDVGGKIQFNFSENPGLSKIIERWWNKTWSSSADARQGRHFNDILQLVIASIVREGGILAVVDLFNLNDGRLFFFEIDQLVEVEKSEWESQTIWVEEVKNEKGKKVKIPLRQSHGVIFDRFGRVHGYIVSSHHGKNVVGLKEATIISSKFAKLLKLDWRINQIAPIPAGLAVANDLHDIYEMRARELQSAKLASALAGYTKTKDAIEEALIRSDGLDDYLKTEEESETIDTSEKKNYERFERLAGGYWEYLEPGDEVGVLDFNRPNVRLADFFDFVANSAGACFGLARAYTGLKADTSYTAFRGEMLMTWQTFRCLQKFLERNFCDWLAGKILPWASENGYIPELPARFKEYISWAWPQMPQIDPLKEASAKRSMLKDGITNYADILGADWREKMKEFSEELKTASELKLPLSVFETASGAKIYQTEEEKND